MRKQAGFSMIELLIVIVILGVIAALATPVLVRAKQQAQTGSAIQTMRTIVTAQVLYEKKYKAYGTLSDLSPEGTVDTAITNGTKSGYFFTISVAGDAKSYQCRATPMEAADLRNHFFVDETGVIRYKTGAAADATSGPIGN